MTKRHHVTASTRIAVPHERLWQLICDTVRYDEWVESAMEVTSSSGPACLGATYEVRTRWSGFWTAAVAWTVSEFEPMARQAHAGVGIPGVDELRVEMDLEPVDGATEFTLTYDYRPRRALLGTLIELAVSHNVTAEQRRSVGTLAILAEHEAGIERDGHPPT